jgi:hypothetical protein
MRLLPIYLIALLTFGLFIACKNIDQTLIGDLQNRVTEIETLKNTYIGHDKSVARFSDAINAAPDSVKLDSSYLFMARMIDTLKVNGKSGMKQLSETQTGLSGLLADYNSGAKKTDEVRKGFQNAGEVLKSQEKFLNNSSLMIVQSMQILDSLVIRSQPIVIKKK